MLTHLHCNTSGTAPLADLKDPAHDNNAEATVEDDTASPCCIGCFELLPSPPELPREGCDESNSLPEPELLCASCIHRLVGKSSKSLAVECAGGVLSPLPKLSLLVKAEAKCQDQMQQLRSQQEILNQQRESLEATKRAKEEALAAERELARQRRKHFLMIQERRKREEEAKFQQFQAEELTSRSEQETNSDKKKKKKSRPLKVETRSCESADEPEDLSLPHVAEPSSKLSDTPSSHYHSNNNDTTSAEAHSTSWNERRRQMMACYAQDLSPLIDGRKPRRLPFPKPVSAIVPSSMSKRRQLPDNNAQTTTIVTRHHSRNQPNANKQGKGPTKNMRLRPLEEQKRFIKTRPRHANNQFEDFHGRKGSDTITKRVVASPLSLQLPRRLLDHSAPLTAEIKPVSWAYELAREVLPQDDSANDVDNSAFSTPLYSVAEEDDDHPQFTMFPLQHQLPKPTFPLSKPEPPAETAVKVPRWEYSAERLTSLLEKYNVSVSAVTGTTSAPNL